MTNEEYQIWVRSMWNFQDFTTPHDFQMDWSLHDDYLAATGLAGETGEVLEVLKKAERKRKLPDKEALLLEMGDVLYYLTILAERHGLTLEQIKDANIEKLNGRKAIRDKEQAQASYSTDFDVHS